MNAPERFARPPPHQTLSRFTQERRNRAVQVPDGAVGVNLNQHYGRGVEHRRQVRFAGAQSFLGALPFGDVLDRADDARRPAIFARDRLSAPGDPPFGAIGAHDAVIRREWLQAAQTLGRGARHPLPVTRMHDLQEVLQGAGVGGVAGPEQLLVQPAPLNPAAGQIVVPEAKPGGFHRQPQPFQALGQRGAVARPLPGHAGAVLPNEKDAGHAQQPDADVDRDDDHRLGPTLAPGKVPGERDATNDSQECRRHQRIAPDARQPDAEVRAVVSVHHTPSTPMRRGRLRYGQAVERPRPRAFHAV